MDISMDIETWGTRPGCDIRSIGAVVFHPRENGFISERFYVALDNPEVSEELYTECYLDAESGRRSKYPLHRDPETVEWWADQTSEAQSAFANPVDLKDGLQQFADWLKERNDYMGGTDEEQRVWTKGPHFDIAILGAAYHAVGLPVPWHYRAPRDLRTITDATGLSREDHVTVGTLHNALDDAIGQALTIRKAFIRILRLP